VNKLYKKSLVWLRRDLRLNDNTAIFKASENSESIALCFIFDTNILDELDDKSDKRVDFIHQILCDLKKKLKGLNSDIFVVSGDPAYEIPKLAKSIEANAVYVNRDYEIYGTKRDKCIDDKLSEMRIDFESFKDQVLFEADEILTKASSYYSVFSPYRNNHLEKLMTTGVGINNYIVENLPLEKFSTSDLPSLKSLGFQSTNINNLKIATSHNLIESQVNDFKLRIKNYDQARNFPAIKGVSYLSVHNRFGTISIRELANICLKNMNSGTKSWLNELVWRDFYFQIIVNFSHVQSGQTFKLKLNNLPYENNEKFFEAWKNGLTGFPIVDAAMRQLNQTGFMHNRLRMIVASFLTKDLLIDWRWGEAYFKQKLIDYDFSANNGGWQWAASVGCDAQPWFRIFNPLLQSKKFDADGKFIKKYIHELEFVDKKNIHEPHTKLSNIDYPKPIIDHKLQRAKALKMFENIN
jgi:deoxyribodipyrimidine photo-lyase